MELIKWVAYISTGIGLLLVILGSVAALFHLHILQVRYMTSYFQGANSFFLLSVVIFLYLLVSRNKKE
jgi:hypothetical protein